MIERIGRYRILDLLGGGSQADVYLGENTRSGNRVAIKILHGGLSADPDARNAFRQEAVKSRSVRHRNVTRIYEIGEHAGRPFMVLEYVPDNLSRRLRNDGRLDPETAAELAAQMADAIAAAHAKGIVHRDVKPANILIGEDGEVKVTDFGVASASFLATIGRTGEAFGTPAYMSPEHWDGKADERSDVYSLGVVLYEMLIGSPPFEASTPHGWLEAHATQALRIPARDRRRIPHHLAAIIERCLAKDPRDRYESADSVAAALRGGAVDGGAMAPIPARLWNEWFPAAAWNRGRKQIIALGVALSIAVVAAPASLFLLEPWTASADPQVDANTAAEQEEPSAAAREPVRFALPATTETQIVFAELPQDQAAELGVSRIFINLPEGAGERSLSVASTTEPVSGAPPGSVVEKYLSIDLVTETQDVEAPATIEFTVSAQWLAGRGLEAEDVRLFRLSGEWQELPTEVLGVANGLILLRAATPGFSIFAVGVRTASAEPPMPTPVPEEPPASEPAPPAAVPEPTAATPAFIGIDNVAGGSQATPAPTVPPASTPSPPTPTPELPPPSTPAPSVTAAAEAATPMPAPEPVTAQSVLLVTVQAVPPITGVAGREVSLATRAQVTQPGDRIESAEVAWGDGPGFRQATVGADGTITASHTYAGAGTYSVTLIVSSELGGIAPLFTTAEISPPPTPTPARPPDTSAATARPAPTATFAPVIVPSPTPAFAPAPTPLPTPPLSPSPAPTPSATPVSSPTPIPITATPAATPTATPTPAPSATASPAPSPTVTHTPAPTATAKPKPTATPTAAPTPTPSPTLTPTPLPTPTPTATPLPAPTPTQVPANAGPEVTGLSLGGPAAQFGQLIRLTIHAEDPDGVAGFALEYRQAFSDVTVTWSGDCGGAVVAICGDSTLPPGPGRFTAVSAAVVDNTGSRRTYWPGGAVTGDGVSVGTTHSLQMLDVTVRMGDEFDSAGGYRSDFWAATGDCSEGLSIPEAGVVRLDPGCSLESQPAVAGGSVSFRVRLEEIRKAEFFSWGAIGFAVPAGPGQSITMAVGEAGYVLGFVADEQWHEYAIEWHETGLTLFIDGIARVELAGGEAPSPAPGAVVIGGAGGLGKGPHYTEWDSLRTTPSE